MTITNLKTVEYFDLLDIKDIGYNQISLFPYLWKAPALGGLVGHALQKVPPQSTPSSSRFCLSSKHVGAAEGTVLKTLQPGSLGAVAPP